MAFDTPGRVHVIIPAIPPIFFSSQFLTKLKFQLLTYLLRLLQCAQGAGILWSFVRGIIAIIAMNRPTYKNSIG